MNAHLYNAGDKVNVVKEAGLTGFLVNGDLVVPPPNNTVVRLAGFGLSSVPLRTLLYINIPKQHHHAGGTEYRLYAWKDMLTELKGGEELTIVSLPE